MKLSQTSELDLEIAMKNFTSPMIAVLVCAGVRASDTLDAHAGGDAAPPPATATTFDLRATSLTVPESTWNELLADLQTLGANDVNERFTPFVGDTTRVRGWINRQLQSHRAIVGFDTRGQTGEGQAWKLETEPSVASIAPQSAVSGFNIEASLEITATSTDDGSLVLHVSYRPAAFFRGLFDSPGPDSRKPLHSGQHSLKPGQSLVLAEGGNVDPTPLLVISAADFDETVAVRSNWPVPYTTTVPRSAVQSLPYFAEVVPGDQVDQEAAQQPDVSTAGHYIQLTPGEPHTIEMHEHEARRVSLEKRIQSASGFNFDVIEVTASGTNGLHILSSRAGATRLTIVDEDDETLELTVIVTRDVTDLELLLERLYPEAEVEVIPIRDTILIRGAVDHAEQVEQIQDVAEQFAPRVLNQLATSSGSASTAIPRDYRVVTVLAQLDVADLEPGDLVDVKVPCLKEHASTQHEYERRTLLAGIEVFAIKSPAPGTHLGTLVSLLVRPNEVDALKFADSEGGILLGWRASADGLDEESRLDSDVLSKLTDFRRRAPSEIPDTTPDGSPFRAPTSNLFSQRTPEHDAQSDLQALREDIRALHEDVRRLIEVLEERHQDQADDNTPESPPTIDEGAAMLFFDAAWCGPCRQMRPIVARLRREGFAIQTIDVDEQPDLARTYNVDSIPAFVFLHAGEETARRVGVVSEDELRGHLASVSQTSDRAWTELGLQTEGIPHDDRRLQDQPFRGGLLITDVLDGSPAADVGMRAGDLLVGLHVWETISREDVEFVLNHPQFDSMTPLKFYVLRGDETLFGHIHIGRRTSIESPREVFGTPAPLVEPAAEPLRTAPVGEPAPSLEPVG